MRPRRDPALARYMAYRSAVWLVDAESAGIEEAHKALATQLGVLSQTLSQVKRGENSSKDVALKMSKLLGPSPVELFIELAHDWAASSSWHPGQKLPDTITHITGEVTEGWDMGRFPEPLVTAAKELARVSWCGPELARRAAERLWERDGDKYRDRVADTIDNYRFWHGRLLDMIDDLKRESGVHPSEKLRAALRAKNDR